MVGFFYTIINLIGYELMAGSEVSFCLQLVTDDSNILLPNLGLPKS